MLLKMPVTPINEDDLRHFVSDYACYVLTEASRNNMLIKPQGVSG